MRVAEEIKAKESKEQEELSKRKKQIGYYDEFDKYEK
jgi:hypothetical protein